MSLWSRMAQVFRGDGVSREIDEELESHIAEAIEQGRDPAEARRAFGSVLRNREESRDVRLAVWLDSLRADTVFGWRQLMKKKVTSAAAVLSLSLAIGACTSAFRLIDALLLRPLPVKNTERLYALYREGTGFDGKPQTFDGWAYPSFRLMRAAVKGEAELLAVSYAERTDLTYRSDQEMEKAYLQYVSGRDVRLVRTAALRGPPVYGRRRCEAGRASGCRALSRLLGAALRAGPARHRADFPHGRPAVSDRGCRRRAIHRNRDRHGHRRLRARHDASRSGPRRSDLAPDAGDPAARRGGGTRTAEAARHLASV